MPEYSDLLDSIRKEKTRNIRQMLYRILYLWVLRVELRVEAKTKAVFRKGIERNVAVRIEH